MDILKAKLNDLDFNNDYTHKLLGAENHFNNIYKVCGNEQRFGCGSYLITGTEYKYNIANYQKQKLLFDKAKSAENILEIGTYMGHSLLIMLLANPNLNITTIDMVDKYSKASTEYLQKNFPNSKINFIKGTSLNVLPKLKEKFDLFHIDGSHARTIIKKEFEQCINLSKNNNLKIIFDDYGTCKTLNNTIDKSFNLIESEITKSSYTNRYIKIKLENEKQLMDEQIKKFKYLYLIEYLKELPSRLINFKAIINKFVVASRHLPEK